MHTTEVGPASSLLRLLQLVSPALPVGAYAYSQGLETVVQQGRVADEAGVQDWILGVLSHGLARVDLPLLLRMQQAWARHDNERLEFWSAMLAALRESRELLDEDRQLAAALARLLEALGLAQATTWRAHPQRSYPLLFALAAQHWGIAALDAVGGYAWSWAENQVAAAIKLVPLGQTTGQRILGRVVERIPDAVAIAARLEDDEIGAAAPGLAMASAWHETEYSRLFRS